MATFNAPRSNAQVNNYQRPVTPQTFHMSQGGGVSISLSSWDEVLLHLKTLLTENEKLRAQLKEANDSMNTKLKEMDDKTKQAHKLYWDARVSVLGIKAHGMKLAGEAEDLRKIQSSSPNDLKKQQLEDKVRNFESKENELNKKIIEQQHTIHALEGDLSRQKIHYEDQIKAVEERAAQLPIPKPRTNQISVSQLAQVERERDDCRNTIQELNDEVRSLKMSLEKEKMSRNASEQQWSQKDNQLAGMNQQMINLHAELDHFKRENYELKMKASEVPDRQQLAEREKSYQLQIQQLQQDCDQLQSDCHLHKTRYDQLVKERQQQMMTGDVSMPTGGGGGGGMARSKLNQMMRQCDELKKEVTRLQTDLEAKDHQISRMQAGIQERMKSVEAQKDQHIATLQSDIQNLNQNFERQRQELFKYQQQLDMANTALQDLSSKNDRNMTTLNEDNNNLKIKLTNEQERTHTMEVQLSQSQSELERVQSDLERAQVEVARLTSELSDTSEVDEYAEQVTQEMSKIRVDMNNWKAKYNQVQEENQRMAQEQGVWQRRLDETQKKSQEYLDQAQIWKEQAESAQADYNLERKVREKEAQAVKALRQNRDSLQKEVDDLRKRVTQQQERLAQYETSDLPYNEETDVGRQRYSGDNRPYDQRPHSGERPRSGERPPVKEHQWSGDRRQGGAYGGYRDEEPRHYNPTPQDDRGYDRRYTNASRYGGFETRPDHYQHNPSSHPQTAYVVRSQEAPSPTPKQRSAMQNVFPPPDPRARDIRDQPLPPLHSNTDGSNYTLPGEIENPAKPSIACPLCGRQDFKTQTELEVHAAKCDPAAHN